MSELVDAVDDIDETQMKEILNFVSFTKHKSNGELRLLDSEEGAELMGLATTKSGSRSARAFNLLAAFLLAATAHAEITKVSRVIGR